MLPQLQAEQRLLQIEASLVTDMKPESRDALIRGLVATVEGKPKARRLSDALLEAGIQVRHVPKTEGPK